MIQSRRAFMASATAAALSAYAARAQAAARGQVPAAGGFVDGPSRNEVFGYGPMRPDPRGLLDLPEGFSYRVVSRVGERMDDGLVTPDKFDGMGCFPVDADRVALVRNHELEPDESDIGAFSRADLDDSFDWGRIYGRLEDARPLPGGVSTVIYNLRSGETERRHLSLAGTNNNCAGGDHALGIMAVLRGDHRRRGARAGPGPRLGVRGSGDGARRGRAPAHPRHGPLQA